jgi:pimeloyl-ACP methyl ester carboxylesterase
MPRLNHIVLIHGASHGAWCWEDVAPLLREKGYRVTVPDLPGLGVDQTPVKDVTMQSYIDRAAQAVKAAGEPVLLVGHSMGGAVICGAAEAVPERIGKLVFLSGLVLRDGQSMRELMSQVMPEFPEPGPDGCLDFDVSMSGEVFYNTCSAEAVRRASAQLRRQAHAPFTHPFRLTAEGFGAVPKTYIVCAKDNALPPSLQDSFCTATPGMKRREMDTDHSPFFCDPEGLAAILDEEAGG